MRYLIHLESSNDSIGLGFEYKSKQAALKEAAYIKTHGTLGWPVAELQGFTVVVTDTSTEETVYCQPVKRLN